MPSEGQLVVIENGQTVLMDESTEVLEMLLIKGKSDWMPCIPYGIIRNSRPCCFKSVSKSLFLVYEYSLYIFFYDDNALSDVAKASENYVDRQHSRYPRSV